ncbi:tetratricopeptide repeat protein [Bacteroides sp.]|uniref:tetratricopeptide repeat protein n=1 Tax=Bacteroides sp. TaxID=29523 RepID=UPI003AB84B1A
MKYALLVLSFCLGILLLCHSCRRETVATYPALFTADSIMWADSDSALLLLEQIPSPQDLRGADRALYALLLTQARYKSCVLLRNDSLIRIAVDYYEGSRERELLAKSYFYWGCVRMEKKELPEAIGLYLKSLDLMLESNDSIFVAMIYSHLGICYGEQDLYSTARDMYKKGYNLCIEKDSVRACYALNDIGDAFLADYQIDSALIYYQQALGIAFSLQHPDLLFATYNDIAALYNAQGKYAEAESCISKALLYQSNKDNYILACSTKGDIWGNLNCSDSAIHYWKIGAESSNIYVKTASYNSLFQEYKKIKSWENAVLYADSFFVFYDSIQTMNDRDELDKLMDNHLVELHKRELSIKSQRINAILITVFLLLAFTLITLYLWRDGRRKKKYVALQQRLMESRVEVMLLNEKESESTISNRSAELYKLEEERFLICKTLFEVTEGYKRLNELKKAALKMQANIADTYREVVVNDIRKTFADVMGDLKDHYPALTNDDSFYCVLSLLHCPPVIILYVLNVSSDALKVRKSRIKKKVDDDMFCHIFGSDNQ